MGVSHNPLHLPFQGETYKNFIGRVVIIFDELKLCTCMAVPKGTYAFSIAYRCPSATERIGTFAKRIETYRTKEAKHRHVGETHRNFCQTYRNV